MALQLLEAFETAVEERMEATALREEWPTCEEVVEAHWVAIEREAAAKAALAAVLPV